jgi:two-component system, NtrC family, response regulator AtoC
MMNFGILVVEDDALVRSTMRDAMADAGYVVEAVADGEGALARLREARFDIVVADVRLPDMDGRSVYRFVREQRADSGVILTTAHGNVSEAVEALKAGVDDYVIKPFDMAEMIIRLRRLGERIQLSRELREARAQLLGAGEKGKIVGRSSLLVSLLERVKTVAPSDVSVVIVGESGTGKELVARALHDASKRAAGPFVAVNCAAFPESLIEAELFGHERGAFTGATHRREGRFKAADKGTLFLDEIGEIPLSVQAKLLRVLQERTFEPLGSNRPVATDVRLICATHRNLRQMIATGKFREDLYYRLNVLDIEVPPLRRRRDDFPLLVNHFYSQFAGEEKELRMHPRAWSALMNHSFPGNVRELEHAIHHAVVMAQGEDIDIEHLPADIRGPEAREDETPAMTRPLAESMKDFERQYLIMALGSTQGTKSNAARLLGISRKTLWEKLKAHHITDENLEEDDLEPKSSRS